MDRALPRLRRRTTTLLTVSLVAIVLLAYTQAAWLPVPRTGSPMLLFVHAGDVTVAPENTLEAIMGAIDNGADGIEFDVDLSADGTWWLMHNGMDISGRTTGSGDLSDLTDAQIEELRIVGGLGYRGGEFVIPRLSEVLDAVKDWDGWIYIHNKEIDGEAARDLARLWADAPFAGHKGVICRNYPEVVEATKREAPDLRVLMHTGVGQIPPASPYLDVWLAAAPSITRWDVIALRPYPVEVYMFKQQYGEDERDDIERAWRWGAKSFLTWDLPRARQILDEMNGR